MSVHSRWFTVALLYSELAIRIAVHCRIPGGRRYVLRFYTVVFGWSGTGGAPAKPVAAMEVEGWPLIHRGLQPMVVEYMQARLAPSIPAMRGGGRGEGRGAAVAHTTDTYSKHRGNIEAFYKRRYCALTPSP